MFLKVKYFHVLCNFSHKKNVFPWITWPVSQAHSFR